jgi:hypothetical protein
MGSLRLQLYVTPGFKVKTKCSSYVCPGSSAAVPAETAHSSVLVVQWADVQCSYWLCGEYEPSKIWKYERIR